MRTLQENQFHLLMGLLLVGSLFVDRAARAVLPTWSPPDVSVFTLVLAVIWMGMFTHYRGERLGDRIKVLEARLERAERRLDAQEDEGRRLGNPFRDPLG